MTLMIFAGTAIITGIILGALAFGEIAARIIKNDVWTQKIRKIIVRIAYPLFIISTAGYTLTVGGIRLLALPLLFLILWLALIIGGHPKFAARFCFDLHKNKAKK